MGEPGRAAERIRWPSLTRAPAARQAAQAPRPRAAPARPAQSLDSARGPGLPPRRASRLQSAPLLSPWTHAGGTQDPRRPSLGGLGPASKWKPALKGENDERRRSARDPAGGVSRACSPHLGALG